MQGVVDDVLAVEDFRKAFRHLARTAQKEAVGELHDVGLVDGMNFLAAVLARVFEGELGDACRAFFRDDLDALDYAGNDLVLQANVFAFGVFAHDDEVDVGELGFESWQILDRSEVCEEVELFAQRDVDALEAAADGRGYRPLECDLIVLDGLVERGGDVLAEDFKGFGSGSVALPLELDAGGFNMRTTACVTSGPMPSPGMSVTR